MTPHTDTDTLHRSRKKPGGYAPDFVDDMRTVNLVASEMEKEERPPVDADAIQNIAFWSGDIILATSGSGRYQGILDAHLQGLTAKACNEVWKDWLLSWFVSPDLRQELRERFMKAEAEMQEMLKQGRAELMARIDGERGEG